MTDKIVRFQVILTPDESKKLIAKAVAQMDVVKKAAKNGIILVNAGSTNFFLVEEITGKQPMAHPPDVDKERPDVVCGHTRPEGKCIEAARGRFAERNKAVPQWVIKDGELIDWIHPDKYWKMMGPDDVYIKGANALDPQWNAVIEVAGETGGTFGRHLSTIYGRGMHFIIPVGLEKFIPTPMSEIIREGGKQKADYSMGIPMGYEPIIGTVITEIEAIEILTGAKGIPVAAGGVAGAEGAISLIIKGNEAQIKKACEIMTTVKGARLPKIELPNCTTCKENPIIPCPYAGRTRDELYKDFKVVETRNKF